MGFPEFNALRSYHDQHLKRWALERAMFANVWRKPDSPAWMPDDFLDGGEGREARVREHEQSVRAVAAANARLATIVKDAPPTEDVPEWARAGKGAA